MSIAKLMAHPANIKWYVGSRQSDGAQYTIKPVHDGWKACRDNRAKLAAGDILDAPTLDGIRYRLAQS